MHRSKTLHLGRPGPGVDPLKRTLDMGNYMRPYWIDPATDNRAGIQPGFSDFGNASAGDCTCATMAQARMFLTAQASGKPVVTPTEDVIANYIAVTGNEGAAYDPATGANDNGCNFLDVLKYHRKIGQIGAFGSVGPSRLKDAIWLFGGVCLGLSLPDDWEEQLPSGVWDILDAPPDRTNGHEVYAMMYEREGPVIVATWGRYVKLTNKALDEMVDDRMAIVSPDWLRPDGTAPSGFDVQTLAADLKALAA
jgi:hypothetical protein